MKLLVITQFFPYPLDSGGNQAFFNMLDAMRKEHRISIITRGDPNSPSVKEGIAELKKVWPDVEIVTFPAPDARDYSPYPSLGYTGAKFRFIRYVATSFRRKYDRFLGRHSNDDIAPELIARRKCSIRAKDFFDNDILFYHFVREYSEKGFDAIQCEFYDILPLVYYLPENITRIFVHHELRHVRCANEVELFPDRQLEDDVDVLQEKDREFAMLQRFDHIITLTQKDKEILSERIDPSRIYVSPAIVRWAEPLPFKACTKDLVFVGSGSHYPNLDAMLWFCNEILPILQKADPGFCIHITGSWDMKIREQLLKLHPELHFTGVLPSLQEFLNGKITIAPIRIGSGMRMKVAESIQALSPFVITGKGIEGQAFTHQKDCLIADSSEAFAETILQLALSPELQRTLAENALQTALKNYNPNQMLQQRLEFYKNLEK